MQGALLWRAFFILVIWLFLKGGFIWSQDKIYLNLRSEYSISHYWSYTMSIKLVAQTRTDLGKGASRRLRHADLVPAIVYGAGKEPVSLTFEQKELRKVEVVEAFYSSILDLQIDGVSEQVLLKAIQRHAFKDQIQHLDLLRVDATQKLITTVPLHFINEDVAESVKNGGVVAHIANEVEVTCLPKDLPSFVEVDLTNVELGATVHLSDLVLPAGVESVELSKGTAHDLPLASIALAKKAVAEEETTEAASEEATAE
jgi:large subunit ribosomal protein L25